MLLRKRNERAPLLFSCQLMLLLSLVSDTDAVKCNVLYLPAHSLPMFRESQSRNLKRKREKERLDPVLSHKPEPPISKSKSTLSSTDVSTVQDIVFELLSC